MDRAERGRAAVILVLLVGAVVLVRHAVGAENDRPANSATASAQPTVKLISLKFRDPQYLHGVLMPLGVQISPDVQTNHLLVIARPDEIKQVEDVVRELDVPIERTQDQPQLELKLYRLRHRQPDELLQCLVPMLSDRGRISADAGSRTLLVKDEPTVHTDVAMIIREIDAPLGEASTVRTLTETAAVPAGQFAADDLARPARVAELPAAKSLRAVKLRVRVCEVNRAVVNGSGDDPTSITDNPLFRAIHNESPLHAAFESAAVEACIAEMAERGMLKVVCEPAITVLSGCPATFLSCVDEFEGPVVIEEDSLAEATTRVAGLAVDLKFVPTVIDSGLIRLQLSAPFSPRHAVERDSETNTDDRRADDSPVVLKKGEVFAASGKITVRKSAEPARSGLGAVSVLGQLLRPKRSVTQEAELIVLAAAEADESAEPEKLTRQPSRVDPMSR